MAQDRIDDRLNSARLNSLFYKSPQVFYKNPENPSELILMQRPYTFEEGRDYVLKPECILNGFTSLNVSLAKVPSRKKEDEEIDAVDQEDIGDIDNILDTIEIKDVVKSIEKNEDDLTSPSYKIVNLDNGKQRLIILHPCVPLDAIKTVTMPTIVNDNVKRLQEAGAITAEMKIKLTSGQMEIVHIIPEGGPGRGERLAALFSKDSIGHMRLRVTTEEQVERDEKDPTILCSHIQMNDNELYDPREFAGQSTFDTKSCGIFTGAMKAIAAGVASKGWDVSPASLGQAFKDSPIVQYAPIHNHSKQLFQDSLQLAYEHPTSVDLQQNQILKILNQIQQQEQLYKVRTDRGQHYTNIFGLGYSADEKCKAAHAIIANFDLKEGKDSNYGLNALNPDELKAATQGNLGKLYKALLKEIKVTEEKTQSNEASANSLPAKR